MRFNRSRYVTLCQQSLVTAAVLAVGVSAAGIKTLDIEPSPSQLRQGKALMQDPQVGSAALPGARPSAGEDLLAKRDKAPVAAAPVTPKVREVKVSGIETRPEAARQAPSDGGASTDGDGPAPEAEKGRDGMSLVALSEPEEVKGFATVGVTWKNAAEYAEDEIDIDVRTEKDGRWSDWSPAEYDDDHGPDGAEGKTRPGTDALVVGDVDRVQMRARTTDGTTPPDLKLAVIDPGAGETVKAQPDIDTARLGDAPSAAGAGSAAGETGADSSDAVDTVTLSAMKVAPKPTIYSRAQWGANEKLRESGPPGYGTIKAGFVHHTVNANGYSASQVPSLLRGIYAYHTQSRGWRDIGYNFLVDRFGRIWEGRYGGVNRAVIGAHTSGYNDVSFAMSAIGNFETAGAPTKMTDAYARLFAWKLSLHNVGATATGIRLHSRTFRAINGHRDAGSTACPGRYLYAKLTTIRAGAKKIQDGAQSGGSTPSPTPTPTPAPQPPSTFQSPTQQPQPTRAQPSSISFPDVRNVAGAKFADLVVKSTSNGAVRVIPTGGQTGFVGRRTTGGAWGSMNLLVAVGDVTGDGRGDMLGRYRGQQTARIYPGVGNGKFAVGGIAATTRFRAADMVVAAGDWNGDKRADVLMRTASRGWLYLVPGTGKGTFGSPRLISRAWKGHVATTVVTDLTGDGRSDLLSLTAGELKVVPRAAGNALGAAVTRQRVGATYDAVMGGTDLTGDSLSDPIVRERSTGKLYILTGTSSGAFGPRLGAFSGVSGLTRLSSGPVAGSAHTDVVGVTPTGKTLVVLPSNGLTNRAAALRTNLWVPEATQILNVGDWNRDGHADLITREAGGDTLVLRPGNGDGTWQSGQKLSDGWKLFTTLAAVGDVTGDGFPDLVGKTDRRRLAVFPGDGKHGFKAPYVAPASMRTYNQIGSGSWRTDKLPGSAFVSNDRSLVPYIGTNGGQLSGYDWVIGVGDVDGNRVSDLVVRDKAGVLWLLPGSSSGYLDRRFLASGFRGYSLGG